MLTLDIILTEVCGYSPTYKSPNIIVDLLTLCGVTKEDGKPYIREDILKRTTSRSGKKRKEEIRELIEPLL
jgi:hypothetical protein